MQTPPSCAVNFLTNVVGDLAIFLSMTGVGLDINSTHLGGGVAYCLFLFLKKIANRTQTKKLIGVIEMAVKRLLPAETCSD